MQYMSEDDAAYSALLVQLLSDSGITPNATVRSWIERQYDCVLSEHSQLSSRPPSPTPSSSLGAHHRYSTDHPGSPPLSRCSERTPSPCLSYDALLFLAQKTPDGNGFERQERVRPLRVIVQEMAHSKPYASHCTCDKPLPAPPPSPASSLASSPSSRATRSCSSTCTSHLPSFTRMLSSDQSRPQDIHPPLPVGVVVRGEYRHDPIPVPHDGYMHKYDDPCSQSLMHSQDQEAHPILGDTVSFQPSPTLTNFSCAYSRDTSVTTHVPSSPVSPTSLCCKGSPTAPGHHGTPSSSSFRCPPKTNVLPASPTLGELPAVGNLNISNDLRVPILAVHLQSRWSASTTGCPPPSTAELKPNDRLGMRRRLKEKKDKGLKNTNKRTRLLDFISRVSSGLNGPASTAPSSQTGGNVKTDSPDNSGTQNREKKPRKSLSTKSSLTSLRAPLSLPWLSSSSRRGSTEDVPPLPTSPTLTAPPTVPSEVVPSTPKRSLSKVPSEGNLLNPSLPPIPQSASTVQLSIHPTADRAITASNFIFRKPKSREILLMPGSKGTAAPSVHLVAGNISPPPPTTLCPKIPHWQVSTKSNPTADLATMIAMQSQHASAHSSAGPPSHAVPKVPQPTSIIKKRPTQSLPPLPPTSVKGVHVLEHSDVTRHEGSQSGTIQGFGKDGDFAVTSNAKS